MPQPRILFIDAYDSFSNNITTLLKTHLQATVEVIRIDDPRFVFNDDAFLDFLNKFAAVVAGPGPGHPANPDDVGLIGKLWHLREDRILPVLGICLGFQSLALAYGASIERLKEPRHGLVTPLTHSETNVFADVGEVDVTQYHSLHAKLDASEGENDCNHWKQRGELLPLAWDLSDAMNGPILMALRHCQKPFWSVQYHPESICSSGGRQFVQSWWREACQWNANHQRKPIEVRYDSGRTSLDSAAVTIQVPGLSSCPVQRVSWKSAKCSPMTDVANIVELLRKPNDQEPIVLESGTRNGKPLNPETGRFSIIALPRTSSLQCRWSATTERLEINRGNKILSDRCIPVEKVFDVLDSLMEQHKASDGPNDVPFWGGLVGFMSYEAGLASIRVSPRGAHAEHPDAWFTMVKRSVVIDHAKGTVYVQSLGEDDDEWMCQTILLVGRATEDDAEQSTTKPLSGNVTMSAVRGPTAATYISKISECQSHLRAGSSYELCLTDQTLVSNASEPWDLYRRLRRANSAPFGAYMRLAAEEAGLSIISSSPERFLSWSRDGKCQFRPIKGTVKKVPGMTREKAETLLSSQKERAENLMIVDLIRHDLSGVAGVQDVHVPTLMSVEEYETVFQLVSVIEGSIPPSGRRIDALARSLPPGSMTGAPKKRSCELLNAIEGGEARGLYSGVLGYLDVGGGADFSVVIRTAFKWDDEGVWRVGAGGAITALSQPQAEFEEMLAKRESVLNVLLASV
ncbi:hypothetical protein B0A50_07776 [Salinomyces thailandicus]|uniref:aminodeoxychorismate synthase n=1 Tax=Salinomyces thailandicus TaxID=706561 RepID=A0A4U0TL78_9PEZI|nr:hypothetical protein B0A50_07776 [Salinomyces thailandica]